jgi:hypothetical protein
VRGSSKINQIECLINGNDTVVEKSTYDPKFEGLNPVADFGIGRKGTK